MDASLVEWKVVDIVDVVIMYSFLAKKDVPETFEADTPVVHS